MDNSNYYADRTRNSPSFVRKKPISHSYCDFPLGEACAKLAYGGCILRNFQAFFYIYLKVYEPFLEHNVTGRTYLDCWKIA